MSIEPDTLDWTWVLQRPCPDCGFDAPGLELARVPQAIRDNATLWEVVLRTDDAAVRPSPAVWSPLEYACHVRDVNELFDARLQQMLTESDAHFANWDQDETAVEKDYLGQDPPTVAAEVVTTAERVAARYERVSDGDWDRPGTRSNGDRFTIDTFARYHVHDLVHHAHDVSHVTKRVTVASYDAFADDYTAGIGGTADEVRTAISSFAADLGAGARVLEIGSGPGWDAELLEAAGLSVRRTDITPAFVRRLREAGHEAHVIDPLTDDLADPGSKEPYDGVWASASLLHVRREDLPAVLGNLASATRPGGHLFVGVKEGDGARFSTHGHVGAPRHFTFWREGPLREVLTEAGWDVDRIDHSTGTTGGEWLIVRATRR